MIDLRLELVNTRYMPFQLGNHLWKNRKEYPNPMLGRHHTQESKDKMRKVKLGVKRESPTEETRRKISRSHLGNKSYRWKGGITPQNRLIRKGVEYKIWRDNVFMRDNYTCQICKARSCKGVSVYLEADHIMSFSEYPKLRFDISNGRTLCKKCHRKTHNFGVKIWQK